MKSLHLTVFTEQDEGNVNTQIFASLHSGFFLRQGYKIVLEQRSQLFAVIMNIVLLRLVH